MSLIKRNQEKRKDSKILFKKIKKQVQGITLIALVVTVIVLLILAGVAINLTVGDNGLFRRAQNAVDTWQMAEQNEQSEMDKASNLIDSYFSIDWNTVFANAQKHPDQRESTTIGIGTDGKPVNMDLWEYTLYNGSYILNDLIDIEDTEGINETKGYLGNIVDGKIVGTVPQYIKSSEDKDFIAVTNMKDTFLRIDTLEIAPIIPDTVIDMQSTFSRCSRLVNVANLPSNLQNMRYTFLRCTSLEKMPVIPNTVTDMFQTFYYCSNLKDVQNLPTELLIMDSTFEHCTNLQKFEINIPDKVTSMSWCFNDCTNLTNINTFIPSSVIDIHGAFALCPNLNGMVEINANVTGAVINDNTDYYGCFTNSATNKDAIIWLKGTCTVLQEIIDETKSINSHSNIEIVI